MSRGTIIATKKVGNTGGRTDRYEYTRRNNIAKAEMNLDKIFISKFKNIKIGSICDKFNIPRKQGNSLNLNARDIHKIKVELDRLIREMYDIENYRKYDLSKNYSYSHWDKVREKEIKEGKRIILGGSCYEEELTEEQSKWYTIID